jgi:hypothetical protein
VVQIAVEHRCGKHAVAGEGVSQLPKVRFEVRMRRIRVQL